MKQWLVESADCMFSGFNDTYINLADSMLYTVDTNIHHVESWGHISANVQDDSYEKDDGEADGAENKDVASLKDTDYYRDSIEYGKTCQVLYVDWKWKHGMSFDVLGVDQNKAYNIKPKRGGTLPFDFNGDDSIDLIVARLKASGSKKAVTPLDLLDDFDLTICKSSFDGRNFRIPDPHRTFNAQSTMETDRRAVVESYVRHYVQAEEYMNPERASAHASATISRVRRDIPHSPFYRMIDLAAVLPEPREDRLFGFVHAHDEMVQVKVSDAAFRQFDPYAPDF